MSMIDLKKAFELIERNERHADFDGPKPEDLLRNAEQALGLSFPPTYRVFLGRFGCGNFLGDEFYGVIKGDYLNSPIPQAIVPDGVWSTLRERREFQFPESHIIIGMTGDGGTYAIDCSQSTGENEHPVVEWWPGGGQTVVAHDFGEFFLQSIRSALRYR